MCFGDFAADALGVVVALMPGLIEQLRYHARRSPDVSFSDLRKRDRRRSRRRKTKPRAGVPAAPGKTLSLL